MPGRNDWSVEFTIPSVRAALRDCSGTATIFWVDLSVLRPIRSRVGCPSPPHTLYGLRLEVSGGSAILERLEDLDGLALYDLQVLHIALINLFEI